MREAAQSAGFDSRTAFARASRLLEKAEVRGEIMKLASQANVSEIDADEGSTRVARDSTSYSREDERILREYEKIAFADISTGEIKVSDKLRALDQYRALMDRMKGTEDAELSLVVNYDYGE